MGDDMLASFTKKNDDDDDISVQTGAEEWTPAGQDGMSDAIAKVRDDAQWIDEGLGPNLRDAMTAAIGAVKPTGKAVDVPKGVMRAAARRAVELAKTVAELEREHSLMGCFQRELDGSREAYINALDTTPVELPPDGAVTHTWDAKNDCVVEGDAPAGQRLYMRLPRRLLYCDDAASMATIEEDPTGRTVEDTTPFFSKDGVYAMEAEDGISYQSMKANLLLQDPNGTRAKFLTIVDSGAAWCALREADMDRLLPGLRQHMRPSRMRFHDAQGNAMNLAGRVPLDLWIGDHRITTTAYVFKTLGASFLLGANALLRNGCMIDCNRSRLYVAGDETQGVPITSAACDECEPMAHRHLLEPEWMRCALCAKQPPDSTKVVCDRDSRCISLVDTRADAVLSQVGCDLSESSVGARMVLRDDVTVAPGQVMTLDPCLSQSS